MKGWIAGLAAAAAVLGLTFCVWGKGGGKAPAGPLAIPEGMKKYDTQYYDLYTDLDAEQAQEIARHITCMAEEYRERTKGFKAAASRRYSIYVFKDQSEYTKAGGLPGSEGEFDAQGHDLKVFAPGKLGEGDWHTIQHEGFHQFAYDAIAKNLPPWLNEGLAEYFGEGRWTGDNLVTGLIPPGRLKRVQDEIKGQKLLPIAEMVKMDQKEWNAQIGKKTAAPNYNYDQAWSMIHFLVHGDPMYRQALCGYIDNISHGQDALQAFSVNFGRDFESFAKRYNEYWLGLPKNPTQELFDQAEVETLTSFLARATFLKMKFADAKEFFAAGREGKIKIDPQKDFDLWLPQPLMDKSVAAAKRMGEWSLDISKTMPRIILTEGDGNSMIGTFSQTGDAPPIVKVTPQHGTPTPTSAPAKGGGKRKGEANNQ